MRLLRAFVGLHDGKEGTSFGSLLPIILAYSFLLGCSQGEGANRSWLFLGLCGEYGMPSECAKGSPLT